MAEIVLGLASSHTPQMSTSKFWKEHAARDERNTQLLGRDGRHHSYDDLPADADPTLAGELEAPVWKDKFDRAQTAVGALSGLSFDLLGYIPAYRFPAGAGVGMAFATWEPRSCSRTEQETAA